MLTRVFIGLGLFMLGYYVGREVGRTEPVREHLRRVREEKQTVAEPPQPVEDNV